MGFSEDMIRAYNERQNELARLAREREEEKLRNLPEGEGFSARAIRAYHFQQKNEQKRADEYAERQAAYVDPLSIKLRERIQSWAVELGVTVRRIYDEEFVNGRDISFSYDFTYEDEATAKFDCEGLEFSAKITSGPQSFYVSLKGVVIRCLADIGKVLGSEGSVG